MPDVRNCRRCGKVYNYIGGAPLCQLCKEEDEKDFKEVKEYLYKYPGASMTQVSAELDISVEKITRFLKEGRLEIVGDQPNMVLECETCGKSIRTGRFCDDCSKDISNNLKSTANEISQSIRSSSTPKSDIKMRYINNEEHKNRTSRR